MARSTAKLAVWSLCLPQRSAEDGKGFGMRCIGDRGTRGRQAGWRRLNSASRKKEAERAVACSVGSERDDGLHYENWWALPSPESLPPDLSQVGAYPFLPLEELLPQPHVLPNL